MNRSYREVISSFRGSKPRRVLANASIEVQGPRSSPVIRRSEKLCILSFALLVGVGCKKETATQAAPQRPSVPVVVATAGTATIPVEVSVVGTVEASETVQVKPQVTGQILKIHFTEGQNVANDALLFQIDDRPFQQTLSQAQANVARDRAAIQQAEAQLARDTAQAAFSNAETKRYEELAREGIISKTQYDQVRTSSEIGAATLRATRASVESAKANLASDLALVEKAKLDIAYCQVRSPIAGRTGTLALTSGNVVKANETNLVVVNRTTPVFVTFSVPETHLAAIRRVQAQGRLPVRATVKDDPTAAATGLLAVVDNAVDPGTGAIRLKATFENRDAMLWPGQFVDVVLGLGSVANATVIPAVAVQQGQRGPFVYRVKPDETVEAQQISVGETYKDKVVVASGLSSGDVVVTDGQLRLAPGMKIRKTKDPVGGDAP